MDLEKWRGEITTWRNIIRWHRDQKGDNRCWLDDWRVYEVVLGIKPPNLPAYSTCLILCEQYHHQRSALTPPNTSQLIIKDWDADLQSFSEQRLIAERAQLLLAVNFHRNFNDGRRLAADDLRLYSVLHDGILLDQHLPPWEEFRPSCERFFSDPDRANKLHEW